MRDKLVKYKGKIITVIFIIIVLIFISIPIECLVDGYGNSIMISPEKSVSTVYRGNIWNVVVGRKIHYISPPMYDGEINDKIDNISTYYFPFSIAKYCFIIANKLGL